MRLLRNFKPTLSLIAVGAILLTVTEACGQKSESKALAQKEPVVVVDEKKAPAKSGVIHLTADEFKKQVFDYATQKEWKYLGSKPAILDFYADWCRPCQMLAPHLDALMAEYGGNIQVYKINTDKERELSAAFGIESLPTLIYVPLAGQPTADMGYKDKNALDAMIKEVLKAEKPK